NTAHAILIRTPDASHLYAGIDLDRLSGALKPTVVATAADVARIGARVPAFYAGDLFCPVGKTPLYLGQPVAMLIFENFDIFDQARLALRDATILKFGAETGPLEMPNYGAYRFTRVAGPTPDAPAVYSPIQEGWTSPGMFLPGRPVRLAHDRYQQFQGGIKRHAFTMKSQIGIDRASGKIRAFAADHVLDGGGLANYSASVATVSATGAIGVYDIPKVDV